MSTHAVHICGPAQTNLRKRTLRCPTCAATTEMAVQFPGQWFGPPTATCRRCGDEFAPGQPMDEDRYTGADPAYDAELRAEAMHFARRLWDIATHGPSPNGYELDPGFAFPVEDDEDEDPRPMTIELVPVAGSFL